MGKYLTANVLLVRPESGAVEFLAEGSDLPEWAVGSVGDHVLADDGLADPTAPASTDLVEPPPTGGAGSGAEEWRAYAKAVGVDVPDDAKRDAVIEALEAAGKPV